MTTPELSVIVPIYNPPHKPFLGLCDSLIRGGGDFEIILVNDGSTDNFVQETLDDLSRRDKRVRVINTENGGACAARNIGIAAARGEYMAFADHDDEYLPGALQHMLDYAHVTDADVAIFGNTFSGSMPKMRCSPRHVLSDEERRQFTLSCVSILGFQRNTQNYVAPTPWAKIYRRNLIVDNGIRFPIGAINAEDNGFNMYAYDTARVIAVDPTPVYDWHTIPSSLSNSTQPLSRIPSLLLITDVSKAFVAERHRGERDFEEARIVGVFAALLGIDKFCFRPALHTPNMKREAKEVCHELFREPRIRKAMRQLTVGMVAHYAGWKRDVWGQLLRAALFGYRGSGLYFRLISAFGK